MGRFKLEDLRFLEGDGELKPDNETTKAFFNSLPNGRKLKSPTGRKVTKFDSLFFPDQELPEIMQSLLLIEKMITALRNKSNVPEEFINELANNTHDYDETIAFIMRFYLEDLREHEKKGPGPNHLNILTRSEIAYVAYTMLLNYVSKENMELFYLIRSLFGIDLFENSISEKSTKKENARILKYLYPELSLRKISSKLAVNPSTVSRWFKDITDDTEEEKTHAEIMQFMKKIVLYWEIHKEKTSREIAETFNIEIELIEALKDSNFYESAAEIFHSNERQES